MTKVNDFRDWFEKTYADEEAFKAEASENFQDIQDATCGWAANGLMLTLNNALSFMEDEEYYLEIGTYGGRSLAGALRNNTKQAIVLDPFANTGERVRAQWELAVDQFCIRDRITLYEEFAENFNKELPPIGVFFYDGNHDAGHTYEGLKRFERYLADRAVIVVDDYMIPGGGLQKPFPGYQLSSLPVKHDTDRWLKENKDKATLIEVTPWTHQQAIICYERS